MAFCHIYARRDGRFTVRMRGTHSESSLGGTVEFISQPMASEDEARRWVRDGRLYAGLEDMPEPTIVRRTRR